MSGGPIQVTAQVVGAGELRQSLEAASAGARAKIARVVQGLGLELLAKVKSEKLTGQVLKVQTGRLRRSINERTVVSGDAITSSVGTNVSYGRFWELGFQGAVSVRAHTRRGAAVRAHQRQVNQAARPFLAPALAEMRARVQQRLSQAAVEVARGAGA